MLEWSSADLNRGATTLEYEFFLLNLYIYLPRKYPFVTAAMYFLKKLDQWYLIEVILFNLNDVVPRRKWGLSFYSQILLWLWGRAVMYFNFKDNFILSHSVQMNIHQFDLTHRLATNFFQIILICKIGLK